jgi:hypothetical protein
MLTNICPVCDSNVDANRVILVHRNGIVQRSYFVGSDEEAAGEDRYRPPHGIDKRGADGARMIHNASPVSRTPPAGADFCHVGSYEGSNSELLALLSQ